MLKKIDKRTMKILYIDMDGVLVDFNRMLEENNLTTKEEIDEYVDNTPGIFKDLKPIAGAIESFEILSQYFDTYILTTAPWKNITSWSDKREWITRHLGERGKKRLIITHRKDLNRGDYLIDDRLKHGVAEFDGEHIHFGNEEIKDWQMVVDYLCDKENLPYVHDIISYQATIERFLKEVELKLSEIYGEPASKPVLRSLFVDATFEKELLYFNREWVIVEEIAHTLAMDMPHKLHWTDAKILTYLNLSQEDIEQLTIDIKGYTSMEEIATHFVPDLIYQVT